MLILSNEDIEKILPVGACLDVLEEAYRDLGNGMAATVPRYDVFSPTKPNEFYEYKTMSGVFPSRNIAALRLNSSVVKWYEKAGGLRKDKLPVAGGDKFVGLVMLFSTETGEPLAIFPDGYVQKLRVAGASAIAARYLARKDSKVMALLGAGWQASAHLVTLSMIRDLTQVKVFSPTPESRRRFVDEWSGKVSAPLIETGSAAEAIDGADMVVCTTNSISALFDGEYSATGYARVLRQAVRTGRYDIPARRSPHHSLARSQTVSNRHRRRPAIDSRRSRGLAASDHAERRSYLGFPHALGIGQWTTPGKDQRRYHQLLL